MWITKIKNDYFLITVVHLKWNNTSRRGYLWPTIIKFKLLLTKGIQWQWIKSLYCLARRTIWAGNCWNQRLRYHNRFIATIEFCGNIVLMQIEYWVTWQCQCLFNIYCKHFLSVVLVIWHTELLAWIPITFVIANVLAIVIFHRCLLSLLIT